MNMNIALVDSEVRYRQESVAHLIAMSRQENYLLRVIRVHLGRALVSTGTRLGSECRDQQQAVTAMRVVLTSPPWNRRVRRSQSL